MARLYLFAEGQTEQTFATNVLRSHLANVGVYIQAAFLNRPCQEERNRPSRRWPKIYSDEE
jgi:hypothetical protein